MIRSAMILAAGLGKRMRPLTEHMPKPLIPVAGKPLIDYALDQVQQAGISHIVVNSSYKADMLEAHLAARHDPQLRISREEPEPLETGGGIARALPLLGAQPFISLNSDTICVDGSRQSAVARMLQAWDESRMDVLMLLHPTAKAIGFGGPGDFEHGDDGRIRRRTGDTAPYVFTGVQILHPRLFEQCPQGAFSMNVLYDRLCDNDGWFSRIGTLIHDGDWLHVGDPDGLAQATAFFQRAA